MHMISFFPRGPREHKVLLHVMILTITEEAPIILKDKTGYDFGYG